LHDILDAAIEISHADMGDIQLLDDGELRIVAQRGFDPAFLDYFNTVHGRQVTCAVAMQHGARVIVEDVKSSPIFTDTAALEVMLEAEARAIQSTPLVSHTGCILGMFSTYYHQPQRPSEQALRLLDIL